MKRIMALLAGLLLALSVLGMPALAASTLLQSNGIELWLLKYQVSSGDQPSLSLYVRGVNNTDGKVWIDIKDAKIDGTPVESASRSLDAHSDTGEASPKIFVLRGSDDDGGAGYAAIRSACTLEMRIVVQDSATYTDLCDRKVTVQLAPQGSGGQASGSYGSSYRTLQRGDRGEDVRRLQAKLIELGYLYDKADGVFGGNTAAAVKAFNEANGLGSGEAATPVTQDCLYSGVANAYEEPWIPVEIPRTEWSNVTGEGASYRFKVTNTSRSRSIKGIELEYYVMDVWGNELWSLARKTTFTMTVGPGKSAFTSWFYMSPSWYNIDTIHVSVSKIAFSDGEVRYGDGERYWTVTLH